MRAPLPCFCRMDGRVDGAYFADTFWLEAVRNGKIRNDTCTCPHLHCYRAGLAHRRWELSILERGLLATIITIQGHWRALEHHTSRCLQLDRHRRAVFQKCERSTQYFDVVPHVPRSNTDSVHSMSTDPEPGFFRTQKLFLSGIKCREI